MVELRCKLMRLPGLLATDACIFRDSGAGVSGLGFRVQGLGFRV